MKKTTLLQFVGSVFCGIKLVSSRVVFIAFVAASCLITNLGAQDGWLDIDEDGMHALWEAAHGLDNTVNDAGDDPDNDGLTNFVEQSVGTHPLLRDTDFGGKSDGDELPSITRPEDFAQGNLVDSNPVNPEDDSAVPNDEQPSPPGAPAQPEQPQNGAPPDPGAGNGNQMDPQPEDMPGDFDRDGVSDIDEEIETFTDPFDSDTDGDGIPDGREDTDQDGASDGSESRHNTAPFEPDTDEDGYLDGDEIGVESDPLNPYDVPFDPQNPVGRNGPGPDEQPQTMPETEQQQSGNETHTETAGGNGGEEDATSPTTIIGWVATGTSLIDPTPISDLIDAGCSVIDGDYWGAALSVVASAIPFVNGTELKAANKVADEIADALGGTNKATDDVAEAGAKQAEAPPGSDGPPSQSASGGAEVSDDSGVTVGSSGEELPMEVGGSGSGGAGTPPPTDGSTPPGGTPPPLPPKGKAPELPSGQLTETQVLDRAEEYLGSGYTEVSPGRYVSADGKRQFRYGEHETRNPNNHHGHFEAL